MPELKTRTGPDGRPVGAAAAARQTIARAQAAVRSQHYEEALSLYAEVSKAAVDQAASAVRADALRGAAIVHQMRAEWATAERVLQASRLAAIDLADESRIGRAENCLGAVAFESGDWCAAERHYAEAARAAELARDKELLAQVENNRGTLLAARGDDVEAEEAFRRALEGFEELGQRPNVARALNNIGLVHVKQGHFSKAAIAYDRALVESQGDTLFATKILINQARLSLARRDAIKAHSIALKAWTFARRLRDGPVAAGALCVLGEIALAYRDFVGTIYYLRRALKLAAENKAPLVEAETWVQIGNLYHEQGKLVRAVDTWQFARLCYRRLGAHAEAGRLAQRIDAAIQAGEEDLPMLASPHSAPTWAGTRHDPRHRLAVTAAPI